MKKVILASGSPRRREILSQVGVTYEVVPSDCEEIITKVSPEDIVIELSSQKAHDVQSKGYFNSIIIGADTVVSNNDKILGKPKDKEDAYRMIKSIQGQKHQVYTGVTLLIQMNSISKEDRVLVDTSEHFSIINEDKLGVLIEASFYECTDVYVYPMSEEQINRYIDTREPYDKAGSYAIQGIFASNIEKICGDYYNVVGFPIAKVCRVLSEINVNIQSLMQ